MFWLPARFNISRQVSKKIEQDYRRFMKSLPADIPSYILESYGFDLSGSYGRHKTKIIFGKASGQLSASPEQVRRDAEAGLGFVVLKTVIAQDKEGIRAMEDWVRSSSRMKAERIKGKLGKIGWTISWKGRGWTKSFAEYLELLKEALAIGKNYQMLVIPSCQFHLPSNDEEWRIGEYRYTLKELSRAWKEALPKTPFILEVNFSPTLAGLKRASKREVILRWLRSISRIIKSETEVEFGIKVMNAPFEDEFQLEMLRTLSEAKPCADFIIYANRLFDPEKTFEGQKGIAYGGPDLSSRNLKVLTSVRRLQYLKQFPELPALSATGDICSGRLALEYILRGAGSCQIHTLFQLPGSEYAMKRGTKTCRALHRLIFSPFDGLIAGMQFVKERWQEILSSDILSIKQLFTLCRNEKFFKRFTDFRY
jgi:dihydroorotate dehydrogenase